MKVSIVIPNWNGAEKLRRNIPKVLKVKSIYEVIVSDDASSDESVKILREEFPDVKLVLREKNGGFGSNVNTGVGKSSGDLIFLLNNDAVPDKDCLNYILPHFKDEKVFSVSLNSGGNWSWAHFKKGFFWHYMAHTPSKTHQTLWSSGGGGVFRRDIWDRLGGLDEMYDPFYEEDVDIGYRATKRGFINIWEKKALIDHYRETGVIEENFSKAKIASVAQRNQLLFIWKNITDGQMFREHWKALCKMLLTHPKYWKIFLSAYRKWSVIKKKREVEKKEQVLTDKEILSKFSV